VAKLTVAAVAEWCDEEYRRRSVRPYRSGRPAQHSAVSVMWIVSQLTREIVDAALGKGQLRP